MKLLRIKQVIDVTGLSRMTLWRLEKAGRFPTRRRLGDHSVAWLESDIERWIESRPCVNLRSDVAAATPAVRRSSP